MAFTLVSPKGNIRVSRLSFALLSPRGRIHFDHLSGPDEGFTEPVIPIDTILKQYKETGFTPPLVPVDQILNQSGIAKTDPMADLMAAIDQGKNQADIKPLLNMREIANIAAWLRRIAAASNMFWAAFHGYTDLLVRLGDGDDAAFQKTLAEMPTGFSDVGTYGEDMIDAAEFLDRKGLRAGLLPYFPAQVARDLGYFMETFIEGWSERPVLAEEGGQFPEIVAATTAATSLTTKISAWAWTVASVSVGVVVVAAAIAASFGLVAAVKYASALRNIFNNMFDHAQRAKDKTVALGKAGEIQIRARGEAEGWPQDKIESEVQAWWKQVYEVIAEIEAFEKAARGLRRYLVVGGVVLGSVVVLGIGYAIIKKIRG